MKLFQNKILKVLFKIVETVFFLLLFSYLCFVIVQRVTNNGSIMGYRVYTIASGSMNPKYTIHDVILVESINPKKLKVGDDIAYRGERGDLEGILVSHRIIKIDQEENGKLRFHTKGINNEVADPSFTEERIIGKVKGKVPIINFLNHIVKNQFGFFFFVFCPLVLVIVLEILETITDMKIDKQELELNEKYVLKEEKKKGKKKKKEKGKEEKEEVKENHKEDEIPSEEGKEGQNSKTTRSEKILEKTSIRLIPIHDDLEAIDDEKKEEEEIKIIPLEDFEVEEEIKIIPLEDSEEKEEIKIIPLEDSEEKEEEKNIDEII